MFSAQAVIRSIYANKNFKCDKLNWLMQIQMCSSDWMGRVSVYWLSGSYGDDRTRNFPAVVASNGGNRADAERVYLWFLWVC